MMAVKLSLKGRKGELGEEERSVLQQQQPKYLKHKVAMMAVKLSLKGREGELGEEERRNVH